MAKIIQINGDIISIGENNNTIREINRTALNFEPHIGDEVEIFTSSDKIIVTKKSTAAPLSSACPTGKRSVNKLAYALLAIFVGGIGIHKFYGGKTGLGILYLLLCWTAIPALIGFIEGIVALTKPADPNGNICV